MVTWEPLTYRDEPYVRIKPTERARKEIADDVNVAIYYAPSADNLTVSFSETVLQHAIDRRLARAAQKDKSGGQSITAKKGTGAQTNPTDRVVLPWLGSNLCLQVDHKLLDTLMHSRFDVFDASGSVSEIAMQMRSWGNIPILNEWKRLFPADDPVKVQERLWHTELVCPGGGNYVWNDEWKTMESTVYGHPGQPKSGPEMPPILGQFDAANFGLTFEDHGLRARVELNRDAK
jgi:hypothetical protein